MSFIQFLVCIFPWKILICRLKFYLTTHVIRVIFLSSMSFFYHQKRYSTSFFIVKVSRILVSMFRCYLFSFNMENPYLECKNSKTIAESIFQVTIELLAEVFIKSMPSGISLLCKQN